MTWFLVHLVVRLDAVPAPPTQAVALVLAGLFTIASPLWLKYLPWTGAQMTAFTMLVALGITFIAAWLTGTLTLTRDGIVQALLDSSGTWTVQQIVYVALKQAQPTWVGADPKPSPVPVLPAVPAKVGS